MLVLSAHCCLHIDLPLHLWLTRVISLGLWPSSIITLNNIIEVQAVLYGRDPHLLGTGHLIGIRTQILELLCLLDLFHAFAAEVLKISETSIVLDVVDHCCKILLLIW